MDKNKNTRTITIAINFDWEDCDDVCAEIMLEDGIEVKRKGVSYDILNDSHPILPPQTTTE